MNIIKYSKTESYQYPKLSINVEQKSLIIFLDCTFLSVREVPKETCA